MHTPLAAPQVLLAECRHLGCRSCHLHLCRPLLHREACAGLGQGTHLLKSERQTAQGQNACLRPIQAVVAPAFLIRDDSVLSLFAAGSV
jgi:hypothetical protein